MKFAGKHVVITGGAGEIGLVMAQEFARHGATITLVDKVLPEAVRGTVEAIGARFCEADVADPQSVAKAVQSLPEIDIAIANAGVHRGARFLDLSFEHWNLMLGVNATGVFLFCQAAARKMVAAGLGSNCRLRCRGPNPGHTSIPTRCRDYLHRAPLRSGGAR
jgi:NAD(P)-dependent dehydrogenase (short-subunit alcohol dehydrogenase family)